MEKGRPHHKLDYIQNLVRQGNVLATKTAQDTAAKLGIRTPEQIHAVVLELTTDDFDKSMTTYADHRQWQDVYKPDNFEWGALYVKLMVQKNDDGQDVLALIVSMKEL
ncbi:type II toxin-antitoxin system MqsR family toxin [Delftia acidovorans]|uniref:type II toxin-antitoxin system MqsR family toxin n=1 Tax=Delftia acidovorans TaxID=80866 RepID=UPI000BD77512|nr:type II toxin-antitoxin system MqsR family toxin [Delftia acidovorans]SOE35314.1 motility quorum-sensing regulator / GCU-specific mRNA interferase toxin [Delftia acidovorans]